MPIEVLVEQHHKLTYADNVKMVAQQQRGRIRPAVSSISASGEAVAFSDLIGKVNALRSDGRDRRNPENIPMNTRRWLVRPNAIMSGQYIDTAEKLDRAMDPTSNYVRAHTMAMVRAIDDIVLGVERQDNGSYAISQGGILGSVASGKRPDVTTVLPPSSYIPANATGLTLGKLKEAMETLHEREFGMDDTDPLYCAISPVQVTNLLDLADGNGTALNAFAQDQLKNGVPTQLLGMSWIVTNNLPKSGSTRFCPVWSKNNIVAGVWQDIRGQMWNDTHAQGTPYAFVDAFVAAGRAEDDGVLAIECIE